MLAMIFLVIGIASRVMFHAPNFTPVLALALFGGMYLKKEQALWLPLALMIISDLVLGLHHLAVLTWGSLLLISVLGYWQRTQRTAGNVFGMSMLSAIAFFVITNFGAWLIMYPRTMSGFVQCYTLAIPFFRNTLASTVIYAGVLFGAYELMARRVKETRFAWIA